MRLEELIRQIDIVKFIGQYVDLEQRNDEYFGLSPFKKEHTPSFTVRPDPPFWYDFSAGGGGNVFSFVKRYFKCGNSEAVRILQDYAGVPEGSVVIPNEMSATMDCRKYLPKKGTQKPSSGVILSDDFMDRYEVNWEKAKVWTDEGISVDSMKKFQVRYDAFSNRLVYPIKDINGKIRNVGGRTLDPDYKAKGENKYCYFYPWGTLDVVYALYDNLEAIKRKKIIIVFEGMKSVLKCDTYGIHNTVAILTSHLNINQFKLLIGTHAHEIIFALDNDVDISKDKHILSLKHYVNVSYLKDREHLLQEKDSPIDQGLEVFERLCSKRIRLR